MCDVKYGSRRSKGGRSLISAKAVAAATGPFYLILIRQFLELIETGLLLSPILFKHMSTPVAPREHSVSVQAHCLCPYNGQSAYHRRSELLRFWPSKLHAI